MAAAVNRNLFGADELTTDAEVEALETQTQPETPAPEGQPPAQEPAPSETPAEPPHQESIPYDRFKALNEYNKNLEQELAQHREFRTRLDERRRVLDEAAERSQRVAAEQRYIADRPDPTIDPVGAELWDLKQQRLQDRSNIEQLQGQLNQFNQNYQSGQEQAQFTNWVTQHANAYQQQDPTYTHAARYAADKRINFWKSVAPNAPAGLAERMVEGESLLIARLSQQYGGQFAPAIASLAREWGFNPQQLQNGNGNGNVVPLRQASPQVQARQAQLAQVQNGQRLQGLGSMPTGGNVQGATAYRNYSAADIANMPEREFMQAMANPAAARDLRFAMARAEGVDGETNF